MKKNTTISAVFLGEKYQITGNPRILNRVVRIFGERLAEVHRANRVSGEVSTHRLILLAGLALAEELACREEKERKRKVLLEKLRTETREMMESIAGGHNA